VENSKIIWNTNQDDTHAKTFLQRLQSDNKARKEVHNLLLIRIDWIMKKGDSDDE
jgi:hypothetical protein